MLAIEKFVVEQKGEWKKREEELKAREREIGSSERGYSGRVSKNNSYIKSIGRLRLSVGRSSDSLNERSSQ